MQRGAIEFKALLFIPEKRPFDLMMNNDPKAHLNLYVQEYSYLMNLITYFKLPSICQRCGRFFDLPLNVSREIYRELAIRKNTE